MPSRITWYLGIASFDGIDGRRGREQGAGSTYQAGMLTSGEGEERRRRESPNEGIRYI
jgi:hypothetical protein